MTSRHLWTQPTLWQIWNHSWDMMIRWEETGQANCDAMKEWANPYLIYLYAAGQAAGRLCGRPARQTEDQIC